jgi:hypothetical protein
VLSCTLDHRGVKSLILTLDQTFAWETGRELDRLLAFHYGLPFATGQQDAWTAPSQAGYHGTSLEWGDPDTFEPVIVNTGMDPNDDKHRAADAAGLIQRAFKARYSEPAKDDASTQAICCCL